MIIACPEICVAWLISLDHHLLHCLYLTLKKCSSYDHVEIISKEEFQEHSVACAASLVTCPQECGMKVAKKKLLQHLKKSCANSNTTCPKRCGMRLPRSKIPKHLAEDCRQATITCTKGCRSAVWRRNLKDHWNGVCPLFIVQCPNCKASMLRRNIPLHLTEECPVLRGNAASESTAFQSTASVKSLGMASQTVATPGVAGVESLPSESTCPDSLSATNPADLFADDISSSKLQNARCFRCDQIFVTKEENLCSGEVLYCDRCKVYTGRLDGLKHMFPYCPYGCGARPGQANMATHLAKMCVLSPILCVVKGCGVTLLRKDIVEHIVRCHGNLGVPCCYIVKMAFEENHKKDTFRNQWD